ncbi:MAG: hypothetical protein ACREM2_05380 [Vulcanimicrobiaceae bacterium]
MTLVASLAVAMLAAGCGGGGGGGGGTPFAVNSRPLSSGNFGYAGTTTESFVYSGASPSPSSTSSAQVTQDLTVTGAASFNGVSGLSEYATDETDTTSLQTTTATTDTFYASAGSNPTKFLTYGYRSNDSLGSTITVALAGVGSGNGLVDELPEAGGQNWTNSGAETITEDEPGNLAATRTYAADGTYTDSATYFSGVASGIATEIIENADGSGSYVFPGSPPAAITISAPSGGNITISGSVIGTTPITIPAWYTSPLLYSESDVNHGQTTIPSACNAGSGIGTQANDLEQKYVRLDTVLGYVETYDAKNYVVPNDGVACVVLTDTTVAYYDFTGQSTQALGITFSGTPVETTTIATTLGLTSATNAASGPAPGAGASAQARSAGAKALAIANARAAFGALVERNRFERERKALAAIHERLLQMSSERSLIR